MKTRIAINGFGRIGRNAFKVAFEREDLEIVAINDLTDTKTLAHLLKHDSNYGTYQYDVSHDEQNIIVKGKKIRVLAEKDPTNLPWKDMNVDVVIESTGFFVTAEGASAHIKAGAKKVVISAPAKGGDVTTIVLGVNEDKLESSTDVISNASCTTNCITPVAAVIESHFGIEKAMMTTVHSYTASQRLQDAPAKDLREARNAAEKYRTHHNRCLDCCRRSAASPEGYLRRYERACPDPRRITERLRDHHEAQRDRRRSQRSLQEGCIRALLPRYPCGE